MARSDADAVQRYANTATGIAEVLRTLQADAPAGIVLEATGGYEQAVATHLRAAGLGVSVINPERARGFARALGARAKTDALDARMLAQFGARMQLEPRPQPEEASTALGDLVTRRRQLQEMLVAEQNRHERASARL
ncbi:IS110 family transposase, partial [Klebsiella aerogenes]|uniref:IS110 family transposase n=1 Tax=Klebsiella aerogenes TaxID=548 RepID=UPI003D35CE2C